VGGGGFNYWSFVTPEGELDNPDLSKRVQWFGHVTAHFITDTRWRRTLARVP
jgi:hypothetical protein